MIDRVALQAQALLEPGLKLRVLRVHGAGHDADRSAAVDLLQSAQDRPQEGLVLLRVLHVVDAEDDNGLDVLIANPHRRRQLGEGVRRVVGIDLIEIGEAVALAGLGDCAHRYEANQEKPTQHHGASRIPGKWSSVKRRHHQAPSRLFKQRFAYLVLEIESSELICPHDMVVQANLRSARQLDAVDIMVVKVQEGRGHSLASWSQKQFVTRGEARLLVEIYGHLVDFDTTCRGAREGFLCRRFKLLAATLLKEQNRTEDT